MIAKDEFEGCKRMFQTIMSSTLVVIAPSITGCQRIPGTKG